MTKKQHYMTLEERRSLEILHNEEKLKAPQIAKRMGFCKQTIYDELRLGTYEHDFGYYSRKRYSADKAQQIHNYNQTAKGRPLKIGNDHAYANFLENKIRGVQEDGKIDRRKRYSPAAALAEARKEGYQTSVCVSTLYSYIDKGVFLHLTNKDLWEKWKPKKQGDHPVRRVVHPALPSITDRPKQISDREESGHKEIDLIVGKSGTDAATLTMTDRKERTELAFKIPNKKAASVRAVFDRLERKLGKKKFRETFKSITTDNGPEFLEYEQLTASVFGGKRFEVYYCHSYSAWEKGTNENHNRLMRRFFPKGTDFTKVTQRDIEEAVNWLNNYPRKLLEWQTPREAAEAGP